MADYCDGGFRFLNLVFAQFLQRLAGRSPKYPTGSRLSGFLSTSAHSKPVRSMDVRSGCLTIYRLRSLFHPWSIAHASSTRARTSSVLMRQSHEYIHLFLPACYLSLAAFSLLLQTEANARFLSFAYFHPSRHNARSFARRRPAIELVSCAVGVASIVGCSAA
jgi:hypothetical protein